MKTKLLHVFLLLLCTTFINAQTTLFEDKFETYEDNATLLSIGYTLWECGAQVSDFAVDGIAAYEGTKFANITGAAAKTNYVRKTVAITAGKSYTLTVATLALAAKLHKIGYKFASASAAVVSAGTTNTDWALQTVEFTATSTESMDFWIQFYGTGNVYFDNIKLVENVTSAVPEIKKEVFSFVKVNENGLFRIVGNEMIVDINVFDFKGQLITNIRKSNNLLDFSNYPNGMYFLKVKDLDGNQQTLKLLKN